MAPLITLIGSFLVFRLAGMAVPYFADWQHALRAALGVMFLLTASAHWGKRRPDLIRMVPKQFGNSGLWVSITGVAEILIAVGLQLPQVARWSAAGAIAMLLCIFPANVKAAREGLTIGGRDVLGVAARGAVQAVFILALVVSGWPR
jgi:uncharacterized membrane protein